jgi:hypothetical protein
MFSSLIYLKCMHLSHTCTIWQQSNISMMELVNRFVLVAAVINGIEMGFIKYKSCR